MLFSSAASTVLDTLCDYKVHACYHTASDVPISHLLHLLKRVRWGNNGQRECWKRQGRLQPFGSCPHRESMCCAISRLLRSVLHEDGARLGSQLF